MRIIAGVAGGRRLTAPPGRGTRPTTDRAREGLFSAVEAALGSLAGRAVLDLYAGSGAIGLEAASRGATTVILVESGAGALRALRANVAALALPGVEVRSEPVAKLLAGPAPATFDLVYVDPPYSDPVEATLSRLAAGDWLSPDALVVVERASRDDDLRWPDGLQPLRARKYGDSTLWYGARS
ncbi:MAG TPA: 16S rRNA (guanine(966)-N(2))-methyltransferase RsmD [Mycobacteriales bacterium]|nr:16S rRNA (guanine(966)-N(2))-methyltransferase RsmD [Mycobacteriales bacterium]